MNEKYVSKSDLENLIKLWKEDIDQRRKLVDDMPNCNRKNEIMARVKELEICTNELQSVVRG